MFSLWCALTIQDYVTEYAGTAQSAHDEYCVDKIDIYVHVIVVFLTLFRLSNFNDADNYKINFSSSTSIIYEIVINCYLT